jgi:hypothetical protein
MLDYFSITSHSTSTPKGMLMVKVPIQRRMRQVAAMCETPFSNSGINRLRTYAKRLPTARAWFPPNIFKWDKTVGDAVLVKGMPTYFIF